MIYISSTRYIWYEITRHEPNLPFYFIGLQAAYVP